MEIVRLSVKGQIVIPARIRKELGLSAGDKLLVERKHESVILKPATKLSKLRGIDKSKVASEEVDTLREEWDEEFEQGIDE